MGKPDLTEAEFKGLCLAFADPKLADHILWKKFVSALEDPSKRSHCRFTIQYVAYYISLCTCIAMYMCLLYTELHSYYMYICIGVIARVVKVFGINSMSNAIEILVRGEVECYLLLYEFY